MSDLLLHPKTSQQLGLIIKHPPQALLITGSAGSGKDSVVRSIALQLLDIGEDKIESHPYLHLVDPKGDTISIDDIRALQQFLKLKVPTHTARINRVVIIRQAERMRGEAQNALLKTLEEPPEHTSLMLTAESPEHLLETIRSRCQVIPILPVSLEQAMAYYPEHGVAGGRLQSNYALSMGQAGLLSALLASESHALLDEVSEAKVILAEPVSKRLLRVDELSKDKTKIRLLLNALRRIAHAATVHAGKQHKETAVAQWNDRQQAILQSQLYLEKNANTKLLLTDLFMRM